MLEIIVRVRMVSDVQKINNICIMCQNDVDASTGRYSVDAKSIMGLFSLNLMKDVTLKMMTNEDYRMVSEKLKEMDIQITGTRVNL